MTRANMRKRDAAVMAEIVWCPCSSRCANMREGGVYAIAIRSSRECRPWRLFRSGLLAQFLAAGLVPCADAFVGLGGKGRSSQVCGKWFASIRVCQIPVLDSVNDEGHMLFGCEQDLDGFPADEAAEAQGGDGGRIKVPGRIIVAVGGLERVAAAKDLPDVGDGFVWSIDKEL